MLENVQKYSEAEFQDYDDGDTGIGTENDYRGDIQEPFNPTEIRIAQRPSSLDNLVDRLKHDELDLSPNFQREMGIWDDDAQSRLIESLLIRIPIPAFYFDATDDSKWLVIDGVQRLTALARFVIDEQTLKELYPKLTPLKLCNLEFLRDFNGKTFDELERTYQRRINETQVTVYTIEQGTPTDVKYNIFKRINTGGLPLSDQEIRNSLNAGEATNLLANLARSDAFSQVADSSIQDKRGLDQECILRFVAFILSPDREYKEYEKLGFDNFLRNTMNSMNKMSLDKLNKLERTFKKAMNAAHEIFGKDVFRSASRRSYRGAINTALFEVWSVSLGRLSEADVSKLIEEKEYLKDEFLVLMQGSDFRNAISPAEARSPKSIKIRFEKVEELIKGILHARDLWENIEEKYPISTIVNGKIVRIEGYWTFLEIEKGVRGWIPASELSWTKWQPAPKELLREGDEVDVRVTQIDPAKRYIQLSYKRTKSDPCEFIAENYRVGSVVQGKVVSINDLSGAFVELEEDISGFIPISELEQGFTKQVRDVVSVGDELDLRVIELDVNTHRIRLSLRAVHANLWEVGSVVRGRIRNILDYGAFVKLAHGIDGLIRIPELSWTKRPTPSNFFEIDDEVDVMVIEIDPAKQHIELSYKQTKPDPREFIIEKYSVGSMVRGRIVNITDFGAFVELEDGIRGLIRISELSWAKRKPDPSEFFEIDDEVDVMVTEIDPAKQHIELSYKQTKPDPWEFIAEKYSVGSVVRGRIVNITNFGAFAEIENEVEGLIPASELSWTKRKPNPGEFFEIGDEVDVMVMEIDPAKQHFTLSYKQTKPGPWESIPEKYHVGSVVRGRIVNIVNFGAFAEIEEGIEGLIHISELTPRQIQKPDEVVSVGDEHNLKVIALDVDTRRIHLSLKAMCEEQPSTIGTIETLYNDSPPTGGENPEGGT